METVKITPDGKRIIIIDLTVSPPEVKRARKVPRAAAPEALSAPTARIFAPLDPVPAPSPDPDDDWRYSIPEAESSVVDVHARPAAPVPKGFLAADLSGSESEDEGDDEDDDEDDDDLATRYPKRTYLDVPYTAKDSAKELGAKWDNENRKWYVYKINPHHDRLHARFGKQ